MTAINRGLPFTLALAQSVIALSIGISRIKEKTADSIAASHATLSLGSYSILYDGKIIASQYREVQYGKLHGHTRIGEDNE
jgi:hypothetical protein